MNSITNFPRLLKMFFHQYLIQQRQASAHTIASYRDTFRLLAMFAQQMLGKSPQQLSFDELDVPFTGAFLNHLENERHCTARTRNTRLAAIRSFVRFVALHEPIHAQLAQQVLAIPSKKCTKRTIDYLEDDEVSALLSAPDQQSWIGRRDYTVLLVAVQTGLRASELITLLHEDIDLGTGAHVRCHGKGRKDRCVPLRQDSIAALRRWTEEQSANPSDFLFVNQRGNALKHESLNYLLSKNLEIATDACASLRNKRITAHSLRHSCAMTLLQNGVDQATIGLWLGQESVETTYIYLHTDLKRKQLALAKTSPTGVPLHQYQPKDSVPAFLDSL